MSPRDESTRRPPRGLALCAWGAALVPLLQLALISRPLPGWLVARGLAQLLEGLVLWWGGACLVLLATARGLHGGQHAWLLPAGVLLCLCAALLAPQHPGTGAPAGGPGLAQDTVAQCRGLHPSSFSLHPCTRGGAAPVELGLAAGAGAALLLAIAGQPLAARGAGGAWAQAALDTLWVLSAAAVMRASLAPARPAAPPFDTALVLEVAAAIALLLAVAQASAERAPAWRGARLPMLAAALCWLAAGGLRLALPAGALWALPPRTMAWALVAAGAARGLAAGGPAAPRPSLARAAAALAPWGMSGAALLIVAATGVAPVELAALALSGAARELAAALRRHLREEDVLGALAGARRQLAQERAAAASQRHALARVVHDQLAPLNGIWGVERELARARHEAGGRLSAHVEQLRLLIEQLRALVRGQTPPLRAVRVDLLRVLDEALGAVAERAIMAGVRTATSLDACGQDVLGDPVALRRILDNLLTNALDATGEGGSVRVRLWDDPEHPAMLTLSVHDSGPGFEGGRDPFAPRPMAEHGQRMGLGLGIVRDLAAAMGGACGLARDGGIWVRLPRAEAVKR